MEPHLEPMEPEEPELTEVARRRVQARTGFAIHVLMFVAANAGLIVIWRLTGASYPWFVWPLLGWGVLVVVHAVVLLIGPDTPREDRAIERELSRLRNRPHEPHLR
ncbi:MAG: 2TM domain-containing protein [Deltaproteobacteria bacterium]|nr:2TM domain-containing protein [Deltaproteobacteria bacterium]